MIRRFFRHLIESLKSLKRNGWMTIAAVSSVMITLSLVAIFASVIANTIKSKGMSFAENNVKYHHWNPGKDSEEARQALEDLHSYQEAKGWS